MKQKTKVESFAREQAPYYLEEVEMTYREKLHRKTIQTKDKATKKLARFKNRSEKGKEAEDDMVLYMTDYINDLIARGMSEEDAFEKAETDLKKDSGSIYSSALQDKYELVLRRNACTDSAICRSVLWWIYSYRINYRGFAWIFCRLHYVGVRGMDHCASWGSTWIASRCRLRHG